MDVAASGHPVTEGLWNAYVGTTSGRGADRPARHGGLSFLTTD